MRRACARAQELLDAGLPLPAVNQIAWAPGALRHGNAFKPAASGQHNETFASLFAWCKVRKQTPCSTSPGQCWGPPRSQPCAVAPPEFGPSVVHAAPIMPRFG